MAKHKWKEETEREYGTKPHKCVKCGIRKYWWGGDYQAWQYVWHTCVPAMDGSDFWTTHETFKRPECVNKN